MAPVYKTQRLAKSNLSLSDKTDVASEQKAMPAGSVEGDDRYPGSFFRIPGVPSPGKTTWSLTE